MSETPKQLAPDEPKREAPEAAPAQQQATQGNWFHRNRWFTKEPLSYTGYQFFRSAMAAIPYGLGMAGVHHLFGWMSSKGQDIGLTKEGNEAFKQAFHTRLPNGLKGNIGEAIKVVDKVGEEASHLHVSGWKGLLGRNMIRVANSPINAAMQIGLSFSMFRFTGGLIKTLRDKVMDEKNTPEKTEQETKNWKHTLAETAKGNWRAEAIGTFWAALTLGFIGANVKQTTPYQLQQGEKFFGKSGALRRVLSSPSKLLQQAAIWTIAYSAFFEIDERIQKDVKLRNGTWKGAPNSLTNGPDNTVGEPPSPENGRTKGQDDPKVGQFFTHDPGIPRLIFRRVLPVAAGISAYAVLKRAGYVAAGGQMEPITHDIAHSGAGKQVGKFFQNAWREGAATAMFGALWMATDAWGSWYDKFFENLQKKDNPRPLNEHQSKNHAELLSRLNAKERGAGVAA